MKSSSLNDGKLSFEIEGCEQRTVSPLFLSKTSIADTTIGGDTATETSVALREEELKEFINVLEEEKTEIEVLLTTENYRMFAYMCGVDCPSINVTSPWYCKLQFAISWFVRIYFSLMLIFTIISSILGSSESANQNSNPYQGTQLATTLIYTITTLWILFLLYKLKTVKRKVYQFGHQLINSDRMIKERREVHQLFVNTCYILAFFTLNFVVNLGVSVGTGSKGDRGTGFLYPFFSIMFNYMQAFVNFVFIRKFLAIENAFDDILADVRSHKVKALKYNATRLYIDCQMENILFPLAVYLLILVCTLLVFIILMYINVSTGLKTMNGNENLESIVPLYISQYGIALLFICTMTWKVACINEKTNEISDAVVDYFPISQDSLYVFQQQTQKPLVITIFGVLTLYKKDLLLAVASYGASFIITITSPTWLKEIG